MKATIQKEILSDGSEVFNLVVELNDGAVAKFDCVDEGHAIELDHWIGHCSDASLISGFKA